MSVSFSLVPEGITGFCFVLLARGASLADQAGERAQSFIAQFGLGNYAFKRFFR
jgi:hypothetical protein